jgi:AcrR family transcriptional regulator
MREEIRKEIILATIECIEEDGTHNVTVRKIAQKAGVNFAAINYYFGSKENLIEAVMDTTFEEGFVKNLNDYKELWEKDPKRALYSFFFDTIERMIQHRELTKSHFTEVVSHGHQSHSMAKMNRFLDDFFNLVSGLLPESTVMEKKFHFIQILSAVFLPGLFPDIFGDFVKGDFSDEKIQKKYIKNLVDKITEQITTSDIERGQ